MGSLNSQEYKQNLKGGSFKARFCPFPAFSIPFLVVYLLFAQPPKTMGTLQPNQSVPVFSGTCSPPTTVPV